MNPFLKSVLGSVVASQFAKCEVPKCKSHSLGFLCSECSRPVCQVHYFLRPSAPPEVVCSVCLKDELENLPSKKKKQQPAKIIEATIIED